MGGGGESTTETLKREINDLKKNIGQQFEAHRNFTVQLMTVVTERLEKSIEAVGDVCIETGKAVAEVVDENAKQIVAQLQNSENRLGQSIFNTSSLMTKTIIKQVQEIESQKEFDRLKYKALGLLDALEEGLISSILTKVWKNALKIQWQLR